MAESVEKEMGNFLGENILSENILEIEKDDLVVQGLQEKYGSFEESLIRTKTTSFTNDKWTDEIIVTYIKNRNGMNATDLHSKSNRSLLANVDNKASKVLENDLRPCESMGSFGLPGLA